MKTEKNRNEDDSTWDTFLRWEARWLRAPGRTGVAPRQAASAACIGSIDPRPGPGRKARPVTEGLEGTFHGTSKHVFPEFIQQN